MTTWKWGYWIGEVFVQEADGDLSLSEADYGQRCPKRDQPQRTILVADAPTGVIMKITPRDMKFIADACNEKREREALSDKLRRQGFDAVVGSDGCVHMPYKPPTITAETPYIHGRLPVEAATGFSDRHITDVAIDFNPPPSGS